MTIPTLELIDKLGMSACFIAALGLLIWRVMS